MYYLHQLRNGIYLDEIWNMEGNISKVSPLAKDMEVTDGSYPSYVDAPHQLNMQISQEPVYITSDHRIESLKLGNEVDRVLQELKKSQEVEYKVAKAKLYAKKDFILSLYQQLDAERSELAKRSSSSKNSDIDALLKNILNRVNQIKQEVVKLKDMEQIAKGFGKTPTGILNEHFDSHIDD